MDTKHTPEPKYYWDEQFPDEATANSMHKAIHGWDEWDKEHAPWIWSSDGEIILRGAIHMSQDQADFILSALNQSDTLRARALQLEKALEEMVNAFEPGYPKPMEPFEEVAIANARNALAGSGDGACQHDFGVDERGGIVYCMICGAPKALIDAEVA